MSGPRKTVHGCLARIVGCPARCVSRGRTRADENHSSGVGAGAQGWQRNLERADEREEIDIKVVFPGIEGYGGIANA